MVRFQPEIEPLVRLLEDTPRGQLIEEVARRIQTGLSYRELLAALLLAGLIIRVGPSRILETSLRANWSLVVTAAVVMASTQIVRATRWALLSSGEQSGHVRVVACYFVNAFFSYLTPAKSGEAVAPLLLARHCNISLKKGLSIVAIDRLFDLAAFTTCVIVATAYLHCRD